MSLLLDLVWTDRFVRFQRSTSKSGRKLEFGKRERNPDLQSSNGIQKHRLGTWK